MKAIVFGVPILGIVIFVIAFIILFKLLLGGSYTFVKAPTKRVSAIVSGKWKQEKMRPSGIYTIYFMTFKIGENDSIQLPVNKKVFKSADVGRQGLLTFKGSYFISFELTTAHISPEPENETYVLNGEVIKK